MNPVPVSRKRLADRTVQFRDASLKNCAIVPLFDAQGHTAKVAILSARTRECWVLDWRPDLVFVPLLRAVHVDALRAEPQRLAAGEPLWLFDPPGLIALGIASLCEGIVAWNAAEVLPKKVTALTWRRDLSRIANVWTKSGGKGDQLGRWKPEWLADVTPAPTTGRLQRPAPATPPLPKTDATRRPSGGWVLDPIWTR